MRRFGVGVLLSVLALLCAPSALVYPQTQSKSITIVGVVPTILRLSLDFADDTATQLVGYIADSADQRSGGSTSGIAQNASYNPNAAQGGKNFEIKAGTTITLGNARLFSNIKGTYTILAYSANRGKLQNSSNTQADSVEYMLALGESCAAAQNGVFRFTGRGVSTHGGTPLTVALILGEIPASAMGGFYTDQIYFSISQN